VDNVAVNLVEHSAHTSSLLPYEGDGARPSPVFIAAAAEIARRLGLDAPMLIDGNAFELMGRNFAFVHYGAADPDGLTLLTEVGDFDGSTDMLTLRRLLEFNAATPAALTGYFALVPGAEKVVACTRFDLARIDDPAETVLMHISQIIQNFAEMQRTLGEAGLDFWQ
jgi:hypothetical protein